MSAPRPWVSNLFPCRADARPQTCGLDQLRMRDCPPVWLKWTYGWIHNWGWAIVIQTLIINLALLPLRISQMKSMLKMQRVAPQIKAIQEKYKKYSMRDPRKQAMNEEIAAIYKTEGVNPAGGCLPLVIQMPFLFAYYRMLGVALDLRHGALGVGAGPVVARSVSHSADRDHHQHAVHAAHDAAGGHGSAAAEDDEPGHAGDAGLHQLEPGGGLVPVLVDRQPDRNRAAAGDEPHQLGRDMREMRRSARGRKINKLVSC